MNSRTLYVGSNSVGNELLVSGGGVVLSSNGILGAAASGDSNLAFVTGTGSLWSNAHGLFVGSNGAWNRLVISNCAAVLNSNAAIGLATTATNNLALVTGSGALWSNTTTLFSRG